MTASGFIFANFRKLMTSALTNLEINTCTFDHDHFWSGVIHFREKNYPIGFISVPKYFYRIFLFRKNNLHKWGTNILHTHLEIVLKLDVVGYLFNGKWLKIFLVPSRNHIVTRDDCDKFCFLTSLVKLFLLLISWRFTSLWGWYLYVFPFRFIVTITYFIVSQININLTISLEFSSVLKKSKMRVWKRMLFFGKPLSISHHVTRS